MSKHSLYRLIPLVLLLILGIVVLHSQPISSTQIDRLVEKTMKTFNVPGIAVGVVKDGKLIHARGYGVRSLNTHLPVDENTLFGIASNSKAFTAAALGILVDEGKLNWNDRVIDYIPEFRLYNYYVTEAFTIKDLLTHRSGMGLGAGDLMIWPDSGTFSTKEMIYNLRFLKPVSDFRTKYDYDNLLYVVAGEVVARISGMSWEEFIETWIMQPLGMNSSAASFSRLKDKSNVIDAHAVVNNRISVVPHDFAEWADPAGGIWSNITDLAKWTIMHMDSAKYGENKDKYLLSNEVHEEMWTPQTIIPVRGITPYNSHFSSYGLGWRLMDVKGYKQVSHTGGLAGMVTQITLIPELKLGIIVLTNQESSAAFTAITNTIKDSYLGMPSVDRVKEYYEQDLSNKEQSGKFVKEVWRAVDSTKLQVPASSIANAYVGTYADPWFGKVVISLKQNRLWFSSQKSPQLAGEMFYYRGNAFVVKWNNRSLGADAFAIFTLDMNGLASGFKMKAVSPDTDFSFDFQDLDFVRVMEAKY
jgi:CubicO group peptidase (beta-lactamase class C family)